MEEQQALLVLLHLRTSRCSHQQVFKVLLHPQGPQGIHDQRATGARPRYPDQQVLLVRKVPARCYWRYATSRYPPTRCYWCYWCYWASQWRVLLALLGRYSPPAGATGATGPQGIRHQRVLLAPHPAPVFTTPAGATGATDPQGPQGIHTSGCYWRYWAQGAHDQQVLLAPLGLKVFTPAGATGATAPQGCLLDARCYWRSTPASIWPTSATGATHSKNPTSRCYWCARCSGPAGATGATDPQGIRRPAGATGATHPRYPPTSRCYWCASLADRRCYWRHAPGIRRPAGATGATGATGPHTGGCYWRYWASRYSRPAGATGATATLHRASKPSRQHCTG